MRCSFKMVSPLAIVATALGGCVRNGDVAITTNSPSGTYHVTVLGHLQPPRFMFVEHHVQAEVARSSGELVARASLYSGDSFDDGFEDKFLTPVWDAENVLRFPARSSSESVRDIIAIQNHSGRVLRCVAVRTKNIALVFDLAVGAEVELSLPAGEPRVEQEDISLMVWFNKNDPSIERLETFDVEPGVGLRQLVSVLGDRIEWRRE